jgi:hypothetical protein
VEKNSKPKNKNVSTKFCSIIFSLICNFTISFKIVNAVFFFLIRQESFDDFIWYQKNKFTFKNARFWTFVITFDVDFSHSKEPQHSSSSVWFCSCSVVCEQASTERFICANLPPGYLGSFASSLAKMSALLLGFQSPLWLCNRVQIVLFDKQNQTPTCLRIVKSFHRNCTCLSGRDAGFTSYSVFECAEGKFNCSP